MDLKIIETIKNSDSYKLSDIDNVLDDSYILYDLRTILGENEINYLQIGEHKIHKFLQSHPYKTNICIKNIDDIYSERKKYDLIFINSLEKLSFIHKNNEQILLKMFNIDMLLNEGGFIVIHNNISSFYIHNMLNYLINNNNLQYIGRLFRVHKNVQNINLVDSFLMNEKCEKNLNTNRSYIMNNFILYKYKNEEIPKYDFFDDDYKFGIVMATYNRKNGKTLSYLKKSINSIMAQTYKNYSIIIVIDKEDDIFVSNVMKVVNELKEMYQNNNHVKIISNDKTERDHIIDVNISLWICAGANSINSGLHYLRNNGYKYYAHLDDDDSWKEDHLYECYKIYKQYKSCIFTCSKTKYINDKFLPIMLEKYYSNFISCNNYVQFAEDTSHSSLTFRIDILKEFYYNTIFLENNYFLKNIYFPSDLLMCLNITDFCIKNNYTCIYIPKYTCDHIEEATSDS